MEHAQKMYLVPQHELDRIKHQTSASSLDKPIRKVVENELDVEIQDLLNTPSIDMHEKAKKYSGILHRYLAFVRQGTNEKNTLTLSLPADTHTAADTTQAENVHVHTESDGDPVMMDILKHMPAKNKRNAEHILDVMAKTKDKVSWSPHGELIIEGSVVPGSNVYDLLKNVTSSYRTNEAKRPRGWHQFLKQMALLNIPLSVVPNTTVKQSIEVLKRSDLPPTRRAADIDEEMYTPSRPRGMSNIRLAEEMRTPSRPRGMSNIRRSRAWISY